MRMALRLVGFGLLASLAGCASLSSLNPFSGKSAPRNPPAELTEFKQSMAVRPAWSVGIGKAGAAGFSPALAGDSVVAAAADGTIVRVDAATGRTLWRINAGAPLTAGVGADGNTIVVAGEKGKIFAFDREGKQRWTAQASSEVLSVPAVANGIVVVRSLDNRIVGLDTESGARRWVVQRSVPPLTLRSSPGIATSGANAYVGLPGGRLVALTINNGGVRWEIPVGDPRGATELERIADISGVPLVLDRAVCAVAFQGRIACVDALTGAPRWVKELSSQVGLGGDERFVFAVDENDAVSAFSREAGASVWRSKSLANRRLSAPLSFGRAVAVGDYQGYIHFLAREDGTMLARLASDGSAIIGSPLVAGSHAVFQTQGGTLMAVAAD